MTAPSFPPKPHALEAIMGRRQVVIGMVHSRPLPGSPGYQGESMTALLDFARAEAGRLCEGGVDGMIVENHGDIPFVRPDQLGPETAACMAVMTECVRRISGLPVGVNVLANGAHQAIAVAKAAGAAFVRVNQWANAYVANEGLLDGPAGSAARYRAFLHARDVRVFADVHVKHGAHAITADRSLAELARDVEFFDADVAVATGARTGHAADRAEIAAITIAGRASGSIIDSMVRASPAPSIRADCSNSAGRVRRKPVMMNTADGSPIAT